MAKQWRFAVSYSRFSDPKQAKGDSQRRQGAMFSAFCQAHKLSPLPDVYADRGRSGYKNEHREKGEFGKIIKAAEAGKFPKGTVVVAEAWDRFGRLRPDLQVALMRELLLTGVAVGICSLNDIFTEADFGTHKWTIFSTFAQLAYQESKQKSERVAASWEGRRRRARERGDLMTGRLPGWLRLIKGEAVPVPERVAAVKRAFALAADGYGLRRIIRTLDKEGHRPFGDSGRWTRPFLARVLSDRRVLGYLQPRRADRTADGPALRNYYPAVIDEQTFLLARGAQDGKFGRPWRRDRKWVNVFRGLLYHAKDGEGFLVHNIRTAAKPRLMLVNQAGHSGRAPMVTFEYLALEEALLSGLAEVNPRDVLPPAGGAPDRTAVLKARLAEVRADIAAIQEDLTKKYSRALREVLGAKEAEEEAVAGELQEEMARAARPGEQAWGELPDLVSVLKEGGDPVRLKLRVLLRALVDKVWLLIVPRGSRRLAVAQVFFVGGGVREYLVEFRPKSWSRPGWWRCVAERWDSPVYPLTGPNVTVAGLDAPHLSDRDHAEAVEHEWLAGLDDNGLDELFGDAERHPLP